MSPVFPTTRRSVVVALRSDDAQQRTRAFDTLVAIYWKPLYKLARIAWGRNPEDAEDLTQSFFTRVFERDSLAGFDANQAAFRTYLRMLFERHAANEQKAAQRIKRGGAVATIDVEEAESELVQATNATPDELFYREWVRSVFAVALTRLREAITPDQFAIFEAYDLSDDRDISYRDLATRFSVRETTITNHLSAARRKFRDAILDTLRDVTASDEEFRAEARALLGTDR